jgi:hypothetical protein
LRTADPIFARRLVVLLDAKLEEIVTAFEQSAMHLTPPQVDGLLRDVVTTHLHKLERLAAAAKSFPAFDAARLTDWQQQGLVPDEPIVAGEKTDEPIRTRGWPASPRSVTAAETAGSLCWQERPDQSLSTLSRIRHRRPL